MHKLIIGLIFLTQSFGCLYSQSNDISLNFQKIDLKSVLHVLAEFKGKNIVVSDKVKGEISLHLEKVPWDQALDVILKTNSLEKTTTGNIMLIGPAAAKYSPLQSTLLQINYAKAVEIAALLQDKSSSILSKRGMLTVDERTNAIWVQETDAQIQKIRALVKQIDIPVKQVLIEARIVNMTRAAIQDLGIRFGGGSKPASPADGSSTRPKRLNLDFAAAVVNPASLGIALAKLGDGVLLDLELSALESENKAEIIASPRLMTINQQTATIESGEEIPYQEVSSGGATAVTFKKAVLSLKVTPQITPDNKLLMALHINQDSPSARAVNGVPAILTKEIQTQVLVNNGQTVVLGGIYKQDKIKSEKRLPFLGKLPLVKYLFSNKHIEIKNEELLIFITPRIITNFLSMPGA